MKTGDKAIVVNGEPIKSFIDWNDVSYLDGREVVVIKEDPSDNTVFVIQSNDNYALPAWVDKRWLKPIETARNEATIDRITVAKAERDVLFKSRVHELIKEQPALLLMFMAVFAELDSVLFEGKAYDNNEDDDDDPSVFGDPYAC